MYIPQKELHGSLQVENRCVGGSPQVGVPPPGSCSAPRTGGCLKYRPVWNVLMTCSYCLGYRVEASNFEEAPWLEKKLIGAVLMFGGPLEGGLPVAFAHYLNTQIPGFWCGDMLYLLAWQPVVFSLFLLAVPRDRTVISRI